MYAAARAAAAARRAWNKADAEVVAAAEAQGISKQAAWAGIQRLTLARIADPLGWRAAAEAFKEAEATAALRATPRATASPEVHKQAAHVVQPGLLREPRQPPDRRVRGVAGLLRIVSTGFELRRAAPHLQLHRRLAGPS